MRRAVDFVAVLAATLAGQHAYGEPWWGLLCGLFVGAYGCFCYWDGITILQRKGIQ